MVTTRKQHAEQRKAQGSSSPPESKEDGQELPRCQFDDSQTYYPVFCLTEVSDAYFYELNKLTEKTEGHCPCMEITTNSADVIADIKANLSRKSRPTPFLDHTIPQLYDFYKAHLRPDENYGDPGMHFTSFTFFAVDFACLCASPWEIILCSDGPDYGEDDEIVLKTKRLPIAVAFEYLCSIEMLVSNISEICHPSELGMCIVPDREPLPANPQPVPGKLLHRRATPKEGRRNKSAVTRLYGSMEEALGKLPLPQQK